MRHNRRRTALTMLGMAWGIATVVMLLAYGDGFGQACANIFANFGTKLVIVVPGRTSMQAGGQKAGVLVRFTLEDVDTLTTNLPQITHITPEVSKQAQHAVRDQGLRLHRSPATIPTCCRSASLKLAQGRFYNAEDQMQHARVAVIGSEAKEKLFSGRNALGEHIRMDGLSFEVIGVLERQDAGRKRRHQPRRLCPLHHHGRSERYALPGLHLVHLPDSRVRAAGTDRCAPFWPCSTSSTRPTARRCECST